ncbi:MAG: HEAT repeat domain-containing protein [Myxococcota bacterium]
MSEPVPALSSADRERLDEVDELARGEDAVGELIARLSDPKWPVRRAVVAALGQLGDRAVTPLVVSLVSDRTDERRMAATVDALVASVGDPDAALLALDDATPAVLCDIAQVLGRRRSAAAVGTLVAWVAHEDDNVAIAAMEALGRIGGGAGVDALAGAAGSGNVFRTFGAVEVLARCQDPQALAPLVELLRDPLAGGEATRALGRRGLADAVPALTQLLDSHAGARVRSAATALVAIASRFVRQFGTADAIAREVRAAIADPGSTAGELARAAAEGDSEERVAIARVLGWLQDARGAASLVELLVDEPDVARAALTALAELGPTATPFLLAALVAGDSDARILLLSAVPNIPEVGEAVSVCLADPEPDVRRLACELLARAHAVSAVPALFGTLDDPDARVGQAAASAIQALGHDRTEALSLEAAASPSPRVRRAGLRLLGYFGWPSGIDTLIDAARTGPDRLRETALQSLAYVDDPRALAALYAAGVGERASERAGAMRALGNVTPGSETIERISAGMSDPDAWVRYYACQSAGRLGAVGLLDALIERLRDPAAQVRIAVVDALARIPAPAAIRALLDAAADPDPDLRRAAILGLGTSRPPEALAPIAAAASGAEVTTRLVALSALGGFESADVEPILLAAARDADESVHNTAVAVLAGRSGIRATGALVGLLEQASTHQAVVDALATWAPGRIPGMLLALEEADAATTSSLVSALARMDRAEARAALGVVLVMERVALRRAAAAALAAIGAGTSRLQLERSASVDPDPEVRLLARHALAHA